MKDKKYENMVEVITQNPDSYFKCVECGQIWSSAGNFIYTISPFYYSELLNKNEKIFLITCPHHLFKNKFLKFIDRTEYIYLDEINDIFRGFQVYESGVFPRTTSIESFVRNNMFKNVIEISKDEFRNIVKQYLISQLEKQLLKEEEFIYEDLPMFKNDFESILTQFHELFHETKIIGTDIIY